MYVNRLAVIVCKTLIASASESNVPCFDLYLSAIHNYLRLTLNTSPMTILEPMYNTVPLLIHEGCIDNLTNIGSREKHLHGITMYTKTTMSIFEALKSIAVQSQFYGIYMA